MVSLGRGVSLDLNILTPDKVSYVPRGADVGDGFHELTQVSESILDLQNNKRGHSNGSI